MRRVALVTCAEVPALDDDDRLLFAELEAKGVDSCVTVWDDRREDWNAYDAIVLRSTWDYHTRPDAFMQWVADIEKAEVDLWNPPSVVRWNLEKDYLRRLESRGAVIPPTLWFERGDEESLQTIVRRTGWQELVVKPYLSASAFNTWNVVAEDASQAEERLQAALRTERTMVQRCLPEIRSKGEWSLVFIAGAYSHAVIKRPAAGDFRVQGQHGGSAIAAVPSARLMAEAKMIAELIPQPWLYARIDGVDVSDQFVLMEVECIEPRLFLGTSRTAAHSLATSVARVAGRRT